MYALFAFVSALPRTPFGVLACYLLIHDLKRELCEVRAAPNREVSRTKTPSTLGSVHLLTSSKVKQAIKLGNVSNVRKAA